MFSKACEYGIKAALYVALQSGENQRASLREIVSAIDSPEAFTAKILQSLVRNGIIESLKGPTGGFVIDKQKAQTVRLSQIVAAIDGDAIYTGCGLGLPSCDATRPCPIHDQFQKIRDDLRVMLEQTALHELASDLKKGHFFLKR